MPASIVHAGAFLNRNANTISGSQALTEPVAGMPQIRSDPCPRCQTRSRTPQAAPTLITLSTTAFSGRGSERNARASRMKVNQRYQGDHQREVAVDRVTGDAECDL